MMNQNIRQKAWQAKNMSRDRENNFTRDADCDDSESSKYSDEDPRKYYGTHHNEEDDVGYQHSRPNSNSAVNIKEGLDYRAKQ